MKQLLSIILFILSVLGLKAQIYNDITEPSLSKNSLAEKIYLQIDNALYQTGETIWYKAVVTRSYDNSLTEMSQILHVELIDENQNVVESQLLKLKSGIAIGSFIIEKGVFNR